MQYKTIILEWLEAMPQLLERLRRTRSVLPVLDQEARQLKSLHESQMATLLRLRPGLDSLTAGSMALEIAVEQWQEDFLSRASASGWAGRPEAMDPPNDELPIMD